MDLHRLAEARSLAYHAEIAARLAAEPELVERALARVRAWRAARSVSSVYLDAWETLLTGARESLVSAMLDPGEPSRALRQVTPFAGALAPRRRWALWRSVRAELEGRPR